MKKAYNMIQSFISDESGATAVEYGIMVALIAAVIIAAVQIVGTNTNTAFETVGDAMSPAIVEGEGG